VSAEHIPPTAEERAELMRSGWRDRLLRRHGLTVWEHPSPGPCGAQGQPGYAHR